MKAKGNFKLSKESKMMLATLDVSKRHDFKRAMIQAELAAQVKPRASKADRNTPDLER
jgi:hypothetical protein